MATVTLSAPQKTNDAQNFDTNKEVFPIGFHAGGAVMGLGQSYRDFDQVIAELAQNQIDACDNTTNPRAKIQIDLNRKRLCAYDNGEGVSREQMRERVGNIAEKQKGADKVGQKGIGNLAGVIFGKKFRMVSRLRDAKPKTPFFELSITRDQIEGQKRSGFTCEDLPPSFSFSGDHEGSSTFIEIREIPDSAMLTIKRSDGPAKEIADALALTYSSKIRQTGIDITVEVIREDKSRSSHKVVPIAFPGQRETKTITTPSGDVIFDIYLTSRAVRDPLVQVNHQNKYSFPLKNLAAIWPEVSRFFGCGHVQAIIDLNFCNLTSDRTGFEASQDLDYFYEALRTFVVHFGNPWLGQFQDMSRTERFLGAAKDAMAQIEKTVFKNRPDLLSAVRERFRQSTILGELTLPEKTPKKKAEVDKIPEFPDGPDEIPTKPTAPTDRNTPTKPSTPRKPTPDKPPEPKKQKVSGGESGLSIIFREGDTEIGYAWRVFMGEKGSEKGCIVINMAHRDLTAAEQAGKNQLQGYIAALIKIVLTTIVAPNKDAARAFKEVAESYFLPFISA